MFKKGKLRSTILYLRENRKNTRRYIKYFDWPLLIIVLVLCGFGLVSIFAATATPITELPGNIVELLSTQSLYYPLLQLRWIAIGLVIMVLMTVYDYPVFKRYTTAIYVLNILILLAVLGMEAGRGGMTAFFKWGSSGERTVQPSEFGKVAIIICLSTLFSTRSDRISTIKDLIPIGLYLMFPLILVLLQPDFGTALVYLCIFAVMIFCSGMDWKLIITILLGALLILIPLWYMMTMTSDNFRLTRILMWLHPEDYPDDARQIINAQLAIGSGGLFGKGIVSIGSLASLGYISDDHTDMVFSIVCEAFGLVGGAVLILLFLVLILHLIHLSRTVSDAFGSYCILGVAAMFLFHVVENIGMVIGLLPCTGIPLPFISYGGSHMLAVMAAIGLVMNIVMRDRYYKKHPETSRAKSL